MSAYSSLGTTVMTTKWCATLYTRLSCQHPWTLQYKGVAVVVFTNKKSAPPRATLNLAEKGSGLALWTMTITQLMYVLYFFGNETLDFNKTNFMHERGLEIKAEKHMFSLKMLLLLSCIAAGRATKI